MLIPLLILQIVTLVALLYLLVRKQPAPPQDPRAAQLPDQIARLDVRSEAFDAHARAAFAQMRDDIAAEARHTREASSTDFGALRTEITASISTLGATLHTGLDAFRKDNADSADNLRKAVQQQMDAIAQRLTTFSSEAARQQIEARESLNTKLSSLAESNAQQQEKLRSSVEERLDKLNTTNAAKLEEMRVTVDEKLQTTLQARLTESFGQVTTHLGEVQKGLGEMKELATGVGDLKKVLSNVKARGIVGEFLLGQQLEQMFSPEQYIQNAPIKPNTSETVEYALKFPSGEGGDSFTLFAIDSKFPKESWEHLEHAYDHGTDEERTAAGKIFERAIRTQAEKICAKYIDPPTTLPHAIMFLPTENLYAEVVRRPGLQSEIQANCHVTIAGPSTLMAILTSFQMGFQSIKLEKKGHEIRNILARAKVQFGKFGDLIGTMETHIGRAQGTLQALGVRSRAIDKALIDVEGLDTSEESTSNLIGFDEIAGVVPMLAATTEEE